MTKYSLETKLAAVNAYLDGIESFKDIAHKHNVNMTMLKKWVLLKGMSPVQYRTHAQEVA
ncbi:transposase [Neobacillus sp. NPDC097160]